MQAALPAREARHIVHNAHVGLHRHASYIVAKGQCKVSMRSLHAGPYDTAGPWAADWCMGCVARVSMVRGALMCIPPSFANNSNW